jgi:hypothetical protein
LIEVDEDTPTPEGLRAMTEDLKGMTHPELGTRSLEYVRDFTRQCVYCTLRRKLADVNGELIPVWALNAGGWTGAQNFISELNRSSMVYLKRWDQGGDFYYDFENGEING